MEKKPPRTKRPRKQRGPFRDGYVHVMEKMCSTCIFRPNSEVLRPGTLNQLAGEAVADETCIICHASIFTDKQAVCRGFFELHKTSPLQIAERMDRLKFQPEEKPNG